jgi:penicillin-binding protein 1B
LRSRSGNILRIFLSVIKIATVLAAVYFLILLILVVWLFEVKLERRPVMVYAAPTEIRVGDSIGRVGLGERLRRLGYEESANPGSEPGRWGRTGDLLTINLKYSPLRGYDITDGPVRFQMKWRTIKGIRKGPSSADLTEIVLEPELIQVIGPDRDRPELARPVPLSDMSELLRTAVVLTEDARFYTHHGIDPVSIKHAVKTNLRAGRYVLGASTIPQQLIRMTLLTSRKTLWRKINEICLALVADAIYSKDAILQAYMNRAYFGQCGLIPIHGVAEASRLFFGKSQKNLAPEECALLVAMLQGPNVINPFTAPERAGRRRDMILGLLHKAGKLTDTEHAQAVARPLRMLSPKPLGRRYDAFLRLVHARRHGWQNVRRGETGVLELVTSVDPVVQSRLRKALKQYTDRGCAAVSLNAHSGEISGCVAVADTLEKRRAVRMQSFLPIVSLEGLSGKRHSSDRFTLAESIFFSGASQGSATFRRAFREHDTELLKSVTEKYGAQTVAERLRSFGAETDASDEGNISIEPVSCLTFLRFYADLAVVGPAPYPHAGIRAHGNIVPLEKQADHAPDIDQIGAFLVRHLLKRRGAVTVRVGNRNRGLREPAVFSAPYGRGSVWIAYGGGRLAAIFFKKRTPLSEEKNGDPFIGRLLKNVALRRIAFKPPPVGIVFRKVCAQSGLRSTSLCPVVLEEAFVKGDRPTEWCPLPHDESLPGKSVRQSD